jgi:hypothetical protein
MVRSPSRLVSCGRTTCRPKCSSSGNRLRKEGLTRQRPRVPHTFHAGGLAVLPVRWLLASTAHQVPGTHHRKSRWTGRRPEGKRLVTRQRFSCLRDCCQSTRIRMTRSMPFESLRQLQQGPRCSGGGDEAGSAIGWLAVLHSKVCISALWAHNSADDSEKR